MIDLETLSGVRRDAIHASSAWHAQIALADRVAANQWSVTWPDSMVENFDPYVENIYLEALEDKMSSAGSYQPGLWVQPTKGTKNDRAEKSAQERRAVFLSYWDRSDLRRNQTAMARDWLHSGVMVTVPWVDWSLPAGERFPFFFAVDPRQFFPVGHNSRNVLTSGMIIRQKPIADLKADWKQEDGSPHSAIRHILSARQNSQLGELQYGEEIWWFDETHMGVALGDSGMRTSQQGTQVVSSADLANTRNGMFDWLVPPVEHKLFACPIVEVKKATYDPTVYQSALFDIIPQLRTANTVMARFMEELDLQVYAPVLLDNIKDPETYGPGAVLVGTGDGKASMQRETYPINYGVHQTVTSMLESARRQAGEPPQRHGDPGASISSAKGTVALQGVWNGELAWIQRDIEVMLERVTALCANMDAEWCSDPDPKVKKQIFAYDEKGKTVNISYHPKSLFGGDYRLRVSFGDRTGMDDHNYIVRQATLHELGGMSRREFISRTTDADPLEVEREVVMEKLTDIFINGVLPQMVEAGDTGALLKMFERLDSDKETLREAVMSTIRETQVPPANNGGMPGAPAQPTSPETMIQSLQAGGVPGQAAQMPAPNRDLLRAFPNGVNRRTIEEANL